MFTPAYFLGCVTLWTAAAVIVLSGQDIALLGRMEDWKISVAAVGAAASALFLAHFLAGHPFPPALRFRGRWRQIGVLCLTAVAEETIWRAYFLSKCMANIGTLSGAALSIGLFSLSHFMMGPRAVTANLWTGTVFTGVWLATGGLVFAVISHAFYNLLWVGAQSCPSEVAS